MKLKLKQLVAASAAAIALSVSASAFGAGATITSGNVSLGVNDLGHLINQDPSGLITDRPEGSEGSRYSVFLKDVGDALSPGCACEGWGASANVVGRASIGNGGVVNLSLDSFTSTSSTATSKTHVTSLADFEITQAYQPSASTALFENIVTLKNNGTETLTDVRYTRAMDWDIPPNEFREYVTIKGADTTTGILVSGNDGFATPNPLATDLTIEGSNAIATKTDATDKGPSDHGFAVTFGFGDLAPGAEKKFSIFYGAAYTETAALSALGTVGAELYSLGQTKAGDVNTPTFIFAFKGVGGIVVEPPPDGEEPPVIPLPAGVWMALSTLGGIGAIKSLRKRLMA